MDSHESICDCLINFCARKLLISSPNYLYNKPTLKHFCFILFFIGCDRCIVTPYLVTTSEYLKDYLILQFRLISSFTYTSSSSTSAPT